MSTDTVFSELPDEIKTEIFSRVPAKYVGKFKCLSKTWHNILSTPHFVKLHLSRKTHQQSLLLLSKSKSLHVINPPIENQTISKKLQLENTWFEVVTSCNGLVLLLNSEKQMVLVNPITFEEFKLPKLIFASNKSHIKLLHGFGYDSSSDDYKILVVSGLSNAISFSTSVDLYTVKSGVWRSINHSPHKYANYRSFCGGAFVNGSFYWYDNHKNESKALYKILAFNLATEVFYEVDIPLNVSKLAFRVYAHERHLCALWTVESGLNGKIEVSVMKEYGMVNSWTKLASVDVNRMYYAYMPLYFSRDENILLVMTEETIIVLNIHEGTIKDMVVDGVLASFHDGCSFVGSLVSLKGMTSSN